MGWVAELCRVSDPTPAARPVNWPVELRSDTFTLPTPEMLRAMSTAELGDDVYGEDPTVRALEELSAEVLGKRAACFMPTGTMANLASILTHCPRGSKVVVGADSDIYAEPQRRPRPADVVPGRGRPARGGARVAGPPGRRARLQRRAGHRGGSGGDRPLRRLGAVLPLQGPGRPGRLDGGGHGGVRGRCAAGPEAARRRHAAVRGAGRRRDRGAARARPPPRGPRDRPAPRRGARRYPRYRGGAGGTAHRRWT